MAGTNTRNIVFGVLVAILIGSLVLSVYPQVIQTKFLQGAVIVSISKTDFLSNDPTLKTSAFLINARLTGASQRLVGRFTKDMINSVNDDPQKIKQGFTIDFSITKSECQYPISRTYKKIYRLQYEKRTLMLPWDIDAFKNECFSKPYDVIWFLKRPWSFDHYCIWFSPEAEIGDLIKTNFVFSSKVYLKTDDGKTALSDVTVGNLESRSVFLKYAGSKVAHIQWTGLSWSGTSCPEYPSLYGAIYKDGKWKLVKKENINSYISNNNINVLQAKLDPNLGGDPGRVESEINVWNRWTDLALTTTYPSKTTFSGETSISAAKVIFDPETILYYPDLTIRLKADWVGIYLPVGKPKIISLSSPEATTGEFAYIEAKIRNEGEDASFNIEVKCDSPYIRPERTIQTVPFKAGEEKTVLIKLSGSTTDTIEKSSCTVTVYDNENPEYRSTATTTVTYKKILVCPEGAIECYGERTIRYCKDGTWKYTTCKEDEVCDYVDGKAQCVKKEEGGPPPPPPTEECIWWNPLTWGACISAGNIFAILTGILFLVVVIIVIIIVIKIIMHFVTVHEVKSAVKGAVEKVKGG